MQQSKINLYNSFSDKDKIVLKIAALRAFDFSAFEVFNLSTASKPHTQKQVKSILDTAVECGFFDSVKLWDTKYSISIDFMLYIYPELTNFGAYWNTIQSNSNLSNFSSIYSSESSDMRRLRNCLYALLFLGDEYKKYEETCMIVPTPKKISFYTSLIRDETYNPYLHRIGERVLQLVLGSISNEAMYMLESLPEILRLFERVVRFSRYDSLLTFSYLRETIGFFSGRLKELSVDDSTDVGLFIKASSEIMEGNTGEAFVLFEKGLKVQRKHLKGVPLPVAPQFVFYHLATLLNMDTDGTPMLQKIGQWIEKRTDLQTSQHCYFETVVDHALNRKKEVDMRIPKLLQCLKVREESIAMPSVLSILVLYIVGAKPDRDSADKVFATVQKAARSGYLILAHEIAYIAHEWYKDEKFKALYRKIAAELPHRPVVAQISRQEEWEKSLNLLLGLKSSASQPTPSGESKTRIVYYFNPSNTTLQPVLQTRQAKGWSNGRNIALKNFLAGKPQGMTPQ
ncbi:MAG: hypothetical protein LBG47_08450, partial [Prevotellaceae bacterium]|nr:hypothetical protein [Prevotellaceae bacterium]